MKKLFTTLFCLCMLIGVSAQRIVSFPASDGLEITADFYETFASSNKYMLMFHQAEYSRGEYQQIAARIIKLDYNCLAVDLRSGNEVNFVNNETCMRALIEGYSNKMLDCEKDIIAAINYIYSFDPTARIFLMGSSFSASLCLKVARDRNDIRAVIAYSPGEFFNEFSMEEYLKGFKTPAYIGCPRSEYSYVSALATNIDDEYLTLFMPEDGDGNHGARTLWWESKTSEEFWLSLLFFLKDMK